MFLVATTGSRLRDVEDDWDFPQFEHWVDYCENNPPLQMMVAAYLGVGRKKEVPTLTEDNFVDFMKMLQSEQAMSG